MIDVLCGDLFYFFSKQKPAYERRISDWISDVCSSDLDLGQLVAREIEAAGGVAKEFNTIAVDDGIAMGHDGMLYSLPSREIIADSVEYMVNAHCADAMVCISNCDKITPGMLNAAMRLNIPEIGRAHV